jgi:hypothetical protein
MFITEHFCVLFMILVLILMLILIDVLFLRSETCDSEYDESIKPLSDSVNKYLSCFSSFNRKALNWNSSSQRIN